MNKHHEELALLPSLIPLACFLAGAVGSMLHGKKNKSTNTNTEETYEQTGKGNDSSTGA